MIKRFPGLLAASLLFLNLSVSAQNSNVTVDTYTGASNVQIPLYDVLSTSLTITIPLPVPLAPRTAISTATSRTCQIPSWTFFMFIKSFAA